VSTTYDIRAALAEALTAIPGLQASAYQMSSPTPPTAHVLRGAEEYDQSFQGGLHRPTFRVQAFVALSTDQGAPQLLDRYLDPTGDLSVKAALEADTSLGGLVQDLHVTTTTGETLFVRDQGGPLLGSEWTVEVWL